MHRNEDTARMVLEWKHIEKAQWVAKKEMVGYSGRKLE